MLKKYHGMARVLAAYSKVKKMQEKGWTIEDIADVFGVAPKKLANFIEICDAISCGNLSFSVDVSFLDDVSAAIGN